MKLILEGMVGGKYMRKTLEDGQNGVGRGSTNQVQLVDRSVSREHAKITVDGETVTVEDLSSRNGTFLNGDRITQPMTVRTGDHIRIGAIEMKLLPADAPISRTPQLPLSGGEKFQATTRLTWDDLHQTSATTDRSGDMSGLFQAMAEAGPILVQPKPLAEVFEAVLDLVERVVTSRRILLLLVDEEGAEPIVKASRPAQHANEELMLSAAMMEIVLKERTSLLVADAQTDPRFMERQSIVAMDVRSALVTPLFDNENVIGLIYVDTNNPIVRYDDNQLRALYMLANLIAVKITQTKLLEEQREKERMTLELATATRIQKGLLPDEIPEMTDYEMYADQWACLETAGDLYDIGCLTDGGLYFVVGDVSGKGLGAALLMSNVLASLRILYSEDQPLPSMIERLNKQLYKSTELTSFVTLFLARLDETTHRLKYVNAGHNPAFLIAPDSTVTELKATGIPVGMMPVAAYESAVVDFPKGALLCVFTDGIPEAQVGEEFYDEERMLESIDKRFNKPIDEIATGMLDDLHDFLGDTPVGDDITLLLLRRKG